MDKKIESMTDHELLCELVRQGRRAERENQIKTCLIAVLLLAVLILAMIYIPGSWPRSANSMPRSMRYSRPSTRQKASWAASMPNPWKNSSRPWTASTPPPSRRPKS